MPALRSSKLQGTVVLPVCQEERGQGNLRSYVPRIEEVRPADKIAEPTGTSGHTVAWFVQAAQGQQFVVCPMLSFFVEHSIAIKVESVLPCAQQVASSPMKSVKVAGQWYQGRCAAERTVAVILSTSCTSSFTVQAVEGSARLGRCCTEAWVAKSVDGIPVVDVTQLTALVGRTLILQRPHERVYVLRSPEEQLSRLLVDLSAECGVRLLAAPAAHGDVALLGCKGLVPSEVFSQIEARFSVVFSQSAETIPATEATEAVLRRLIAFGAKHALCQDSWQSVEHPYRLFQTQTASAMEVLQRPSLRMPCVDVTCVRATATQQKIVAELCLSPAVRLIQPLATFLTRAAQSPDLAGRFRLEGSKAVFRPVTHVLPRLTPAEVTHVWTNGFLPTMQLPVELQSKEAFVEYWRLIHGLRLTDAELSTFARVEFSSYEKYSGLVLTYPVACLWRTPWTEQPALSRQHGPSILKQVLQSLEQHSAFASEIVCQETADPLSLHLAPEESLKPMKLPQSQSVPAKPESSESARPARGKRRLILPILQAPSRDSNSRRRLG